MSFETAKDFEKYARDCVRLAEQPRLPTEVRQQLLEMAREWMMQAMMGQEGGVPASEVERASKP